MVGVRAQLGRLLVDEVLEDALVVLLLVRVAGPQVVDHDFEELLELDLAALGLVDFGHDVVRDVPLRVVPEDPHRVHQVVRAQVPAARTVQVVEHLRLAMSFIECFFITNLGNLFPFFVQSFVFLSK